MLDEGGQLFTERPSILLVQVDLVLHAADREPHGLVSRAAIKIVFERDHYLRCHSRPPCCAGLPAPYKINCHVAAPATRQMPTSPTRHARAAQYPRNSVRSSQAHTASCPDTHAGGRRPATSAGNSTITWEPRWEPSCGVFRTSPDRSRQSHRRYI